MRRQPALKHVAGLMATLLMVMPGAHAQQGDNLREAAQNPIADLISLPFQNNTNFNIGHTPNEEARDIIDPIEHAPLQVWAT
jgi:hypothetical protein